MNDYTREQCLHAMQVHLRRVRKLSRPPAQDALEQFGRHQAQAEHLRMAALWAQCAEALR